MHLGEQSVLFTLEVKHHTSCPKRVHHDKSICPQQLDHYPTRKHQKLIITLKAPHNKTQLKKGPIVT